MSASLTALDVAVMGWLRAFHAPWLDTGMTWISAGGGAGMVWLTLAFIALWRPSDRQAAWRVMLAVMLAYALVDGILKPIIGRARPVIAEAVAMNPSSGNGNLVASTRVLPRMPESLAFPSGHATASFAAAVTVSRMWPRTAALWWALALLIGYSRIYLGHHYPLDIVAGALLGIAVAWWVLGGRALNRRAGR